MAPWVTMHAWPNGEAFPCCAIQNEGVMDGKGMGNLNTQTVEEIWNSPTMRDLRKGMLADEYNPICKKCIESEAHGNKFTLRKTLNNYFIESNWHRVQATNEDYTHDDPRMLYWDIRFNNLCNMKCRSCGPEFSTQWHEDFKALQGEFLGPKYKGLPKKFWAEILPRITEVEYAYFAGGEPLITDEHYRMLDVWLEAGNTKLKIDYNTNFSRMNLGNKHAFDYWNKFENINVGASLDASYARGEYMRSGTVWKTIVQNRRDMMREVPHANFFISPTVSLYNILHLPDFHREWVELGFVKPHSINLANTLFEPQWMRAQHLPDDMKLEVRRKYEAHIEWLHSIESFYTEPWEKIIAFVERKPSDISKLVSFVDYNQRLDKIRKERFADVFPELKDIIK